MPSTTVEKSIFIIFGLAIFSAIGIPLFNAIQDIIIVDRNTRDFDSVVNKIELGIRIVEYNGSSVYSSTVGIRAGMSIILIADSWGVQVEYITAQVHLMKSIYSRTCPISLLCEIEEGVYELNIEMINGFIMIQFLN